MLLSRASVVLLALLVDVGAARAISVSSMPSGEAAPPAPAPEWASGKLANNEILTFTDAMPWLRYVRTHGVLQFIATFNRLKDVTSDELLWGDEIEYHLLTADPAQRRVKLSLRATEVMQGLQAKEQALGRRDGYGEACSWHPEYGAWMVEGTPRVPYGGFTADLCRVELNMRLRRRRLAAMLRPGELAVTMPAFPLMGVGQFAEPHAAPNGPSAASDFIPDEVITPVPRFHALTRNIRKRRGSKVEVRLPLLRDSKTPPAELERGIVMDAMAYGMGCCCLQVTFQARDIDESRHLYDHLAVLAPIALALTAATPIMHGRLADTDVRWSVVAGSVDDRTPMERDGAPPPDDGAWAGGTTEQLAGGGVSRLPKSRYESISNYIANCKGCTARYNDLDPPVERGALKMLLEAGVDKGLAQHIAHLFVRDPLVIMKASAHLAPRAHLARARERVSAAAPPSRDPPTPSPPRDLLAGSHPPRRRVRDGPL